VVYLYGESKVPYGSSSVQLVELGLVAVFVVVVLAGLLVETVGDGALVLCTDMY
jgi:hypothetical protein